MKKIIIAIILIIAFLFTSSASAGEVIYGKPEFRGRVIDADTKQPIEGAVVVVLYYKRPIVGGPGGPSSYVFKARETLTDSKGEFYFPTYSSLMTFTVDAGVNFIFYKPGYMASYGPTNIKPILIETYFSTGNIGEDLEIEGGTFEQGSYTKWKGPLGILVLQKAKTREEKWKSTMVFSSSLNSKDLPLLYRSIDEAERELQKEGIR